MNPYREGSSGAYVEGTGSIGGWEKCEMRTYLNNTIKPLIPADVASMIKAVTKTQDAYDTTAAKFTQTTSDEVWIPDYNEVATSTCRYVDLFPNAASRIKQEWDTSEASFWWLRTAYSATQFRAIKSAGSSNDVDPTYTNYYICLGFCVGKKEG